MLRDLRRSDVVVSVMAREIDSLDALNEEIATHNAAYPADPWRLYIDTVPSIEDAPMCEIWIADAVTNKLKIHPTMGTKYHLLVLRTEVTGRRYAWEADATALNGVLYLDYPPPDEVAPPPPPTEEQLYAQYSMYVVNVNGNIKYELHINIFIY